jgi:hypothetical protein
MVSERQLNLPIEVVEIIIDNVPDGRTFISCSLVCKSWLARCRFYLFSRISVAAANCDRVLPYLNGPSQAGLFVQSLVITKSASDILAHESIGRAADALVRSCPSIRELQMRGVTDWSIERFLDPLVEQLEDLTLADVTVDNWSVISQRLSKCSDRLKCLRISSVKFTNNKSHVASSQNGPQVEGSSTSFVNLERLAIESQCHGYSFAGMLLDQVIQAQASNLRAIELPFPMPPNAQQFLLTLGQNLTSLEIHCESFQAYSPNDGANHSPFSTTFNSPKNLVQSLNEFSLDLSQCRHLTHLHFKNIHAHNDYGGPSLAILQCLVRTLARFPFSSIKHVHLSYRAGLSLSPYVPEDWKALDDTLSMPHMVNLQSLQLSGLFFIAGRVGNMLSQTRSRGIVHWD